MKITIEVEKLNGTTTYEFYPLDLPGYLAGGEMKEPERQIIGTALRQVADAIDGGS